MINLCIKNRTLRSVISQQRHNIKYDILLCYFKFKIQNKQICAQIEAFQFCRVKLSHYFFYSFYGEKVNLNIERKDQPKIKLDFPPGGFNTFSPLPFLD